MKLQAMTVVNGVLRTLLPPLSSEGMSEQACLPSRLMPSELICDMC